MGMAPGSWDQRFDRDLLKRVDTAAKRRGISRSAWVLYTVSRALDVGEE